MNVILRRITRYELALFAIVLLGASLRVYQLGTESVWVDEAFSVFVSKMSVSLIAAKAAGSDAHPPLYYFLLHYWMQLFGTSEFAIRLLSTVFGILAIPVIYLVGRHLFNKEVGLVAALFLAVSSLNIEYSQEARMYSLMVLLALVSMYFLIRLVQRGTVVSLAGYVLATTAMLYTHTFALFVVIAQNLYVVLLLFVVRQRPFSFRRWVALQIGVFVLYIPWIGALLRQTAGWQQWKGGGPVTVNAVLIVLVDTLKAYAGSAVSVTLVVALSILALFSYRKVGGTMEWKDPIRALERYRWHVRLTNVEGALLLELWLFVLLIVPMVISVSYFNIYYVRYLIAGSVALYLLAAAGFSNIKRRHVKLAVLVLVTLLLAAPLQTYYPKITKPQAREAVNAVNQHAQSGDTVIFSPSSSALVWYYYSTRADLHLESWDVRGNNDSVSRAELEATINGSSRVWMFEAAYPSTRELLLSTFNESSYTRTYNGSFPYYQVHLFEKRR